MEILEWISSPVATNWIALISAVSAIVAAIFAGWGVFIVLRDRAGGIYIEWDPPERLDQPARFRLRGVLVNRLGVTVKPYAVQILPSSHGCLPSRESKHESWAINMCAVGIYELPHGRDEAFNFIIAPDEKAIARHKKKIFYRASQALWVHLWKAGFRNRSYPFGVPIRISVTVRRKTSNSRTIRLTHNIRIPDNIIDDRHATAADKTTDAVNKS